MTSHLMAVSEFVEGAAPDQDTDSSGRLPPPPPPPQPQRPVGLRQNQRNKLKTPQGLWAGSFQQGVIRMGGRVQAHTTMRMQYKAGTRFRSTQQGFSGHQGFPGPQGLPYQHQIGTRNHMRQNDGM